MRIRFRPAHSFLLSFLILNCAFSPAARSQSAAPISGDNSSELSAVNFSNLIARRISLLESQIADIESSEGPYASTLLDPLRNLTYVYVSIGAFEAAEVLLQKRVRIHRINDSPSTLNQLDTVMEVITNDLRLGKLQSISDQLKFLNWVHSRNPNSSVAARLESMVNLATWHQAAVNIDQLENRVPHFLEYRRVTEAMLELAEREYGEENTELIPWLYRYALLQWHRFSFSIARDELGGDFRVRVANGRFTEGRRSALATIRRIQNLVESGGNLEAQALALIYEADFMKLLNTVAPINNKYRQAKRMLIDAGIPLERIETLFTQPTIIPMAQFHPTIEAAIAEQEPVTIQMQLEPETEVEEVIKVTDFAAWNESLPFTRRPSLSKMLANIETPMHSVLMEISIGGNGYPRVVEVISASTERPAVIRHAMSAVGNLNFRPNSIYWWLSAKKSVNLLYMYPPKRDLEEEDS